MTATSLHPERLGIYGGAFDPPHLAHRVIADAAVQQLSLDELLVLPTGQAWHRAATMSPQVHRLAMARLAFDGLPRVRVDERELHRPGATYTIDTLEELRADHPRAQLFLVIGEDQWRSFQHWHRHEDIARLVTVCVASRSSRGHGAPPQAASVASPARRIAFEPMAHSATEIRQRVAAGQGIDHLVPPAVARYIAEHQLYRPA